MRYDVKQLDDGWFVVEVAFGSKPDPVSGPFETEFGAEQRQLTIETVQALERACELLQRSQPPKVADEFQNADAQVLHEFLNEHYEFQ